jgi:signal transduction histidine kinase
VHYVEPGTKRKAVLGVAMDITEQKQAEKERSRMIADMMQRNNDLEQFSYIISHNLRSPIANIMGLAELITLPNLSKEDEKEIMEGVLSSVKRLDDITIDLNYILQVRQGINEQKELVRFSSLMSNIKNSIANIIRIEGVTINCEFQAINELFTVKSYLHSIFFNLISNSIKYRRADVNPEINIRSEKEDGYVYIVISDNGMGIDLQNRGKEVFRLYKRFHFHVEGKGIGLYMVKTQVESLGGKISVKSEVNKGTEFRLEFSIP